MTFVATFFIGCIADEVGGIYLLSFPTDSLHSVANQKKHFSFNASGTWTAKSSEDWLKVEPQTGKGGRNTITVQTLSQNQTKQIRKADVLIASDGKSRSIQVVQRDDYALFDSTEYIVEASGGEVNASFTTNIPKGKLYVSYYKYDWFQIGDSKENTRVEEWNAKIKTITIAPNETAEQRRNILVLGIYDENQVFLRLDSAFVTQKGATALPLTP